MEADVLRLIEPAKQLAIDVPDGFSISRVQMKFRIGYTLASKVVEELERQGVVGPWDNIAKCRPVLLSREAEYNAALAQEEQG